MGSLKVLFQVADALLGLARSRVQTRHDFQRILLSSQGRHNRRRECEITRAEASFFRWHEKSLGGRFRLFERCNRRQSGNRRRSHVSPRPCCCFFNRLCTWTPRRPYAYHTDNISSRTVVTSTRIQTWNSIFRYCMRLSGTRWDFAR